MAGRAQLQIGFYTDPTDSTIRQVTVSPDITTDPEPEIIRADRTLSIITSLVVNPSQLSVIDDFMRTGAVPPLPASK